MLYLVLNACEFLDKKVFLFVEQAAKKISNPVITAYLNVLVFNVKRFNN